MLSARAACAVLGLSYGAPKSEIKAAFRSLMRRWHPDHNNASAESTLMTQALNEAREVLLLSGEADALWRLEETLRQQREERLRVEREMERIRRDAAEARLHHDKEMDRIRRVGEETRVRREREAEEARVRHEREMERIRREGEEAHVLREWEAEEARVRHEEDRLRREAELVRREGERVARGVPRVRLTSTARAVYIEGLFRRHHEERARCAAASSGTRAPQKAPRRVAKRAPQSSPSGSHHQALLTTNTEA